VKRKVVCTLGVMLLMAGLVAVSTPAKAEVYVEAYLGGVKAGDLNTSTTWNYPTIPGFHDRVNMPGVSNTSIIGGVKLGTWFVPTGFLGYNYPEWMKYFGFYTDFSFHRLDVQNTKGHATDVDSGVAVFDFPINFMTEGTVATWAFMFAARYGFLPDREVPFGRLQPYVGVGPAIMFSSQHATINFSPEIGGGIRTGSQNSTDIALAVDAGIRYMCLRNVSIDLSFKYRYANPSYDFSGVDNEINGGVGFPVSYKFEPSYNLFSGQLGVAYHF
jgi:opacity protein-like surface antigen